MKKIVFPVSPEYVILRPAFSLFLPIDDLDRGGRPLMEGRSLACRPSPEDYRICNFAGSRYKNQKKMNVGALRYLIECIDDVYLLIDSLAASARRNGEVKKNASLQQVFSLAYSGLRIPYGEAIKCRIEARPYLVSAEYATFSKLCHGLTHLFLSIVAKNPNASSLTFTPEKLYEIADSEGIFIGNSEVCAGPRILIVKVLTRMMDALCKDHPPSIVEDGNNRFAVEFGRIGYCVEMISLIYESVRASAWRIRNGLKKESRQLRPVNEVEPKARFAYPDCGLAHHLSMCKKPLRNEFILGRLSLCWGAAEKSREDLKGLMSIGDELLGSLAHGKTDTAAGQWQCFNSFSINAISCASKQIAETLNLRVQTFCCDEQAMRLIFGVSPFAGYRE